MTRSKRARPLARAIAAVLLAGASVALPARAEESGSFLLLSSRHPAVLVEDDAIRRVTGRPGHYLETPVHLPRVSLTFNPVAMMERTGELVVSRELEGGLTDMVEGWDFSAPRATFVPKRDVAGDFRLTRCEGAEGNAWRGDGGTWVRCRIESLSAAEQPVLWTPALYQRVFQEAKQGKLFDLTLALNLVPRAEVTRPRRSVDADFRWTQMPALARALAEADHGGGDGSLDRTWAEQFVSDFLDRELARPCARREGAGVDLPADDGLDNACRQIAADRDRERRARNHRKLSQSLIAEAKRRLLLDAPDCDAGWIATPAMIERAEERSGRPHIELHLYDVPQRTSYEEQQLFRVRYRPRLVPTYN
ncbi:hypothetical protein [Sorangium sp. So ce542]|uniref:hypothetical protein n=1 Tax=Sorangium sp. So ce542 TaxID=3133316 RepID=UPI003F630974